MSVIYSTAFADNFVSWDLVLNTPVAKAGLGCLGGYAFTCSDVVSLYKAVATYASPLTAITVRAEYAFFSTFAPTTLDGVNTELKIFEINDAVVLGTTYYTASFNSLVLLVADGTIRVKISTGLNSPLFDVMDSAAGVFPIDGTLHAIQVLYSFPHTYQVDVIVVLDNVIIISDSYSTTNHALYWTKNTGAVSAGVNEVALFASRGAAGSTWMSSFGGVEIDDTARNANYGACPARTLAAGICASSFPLGVGGAGQRRVAGVAPDVRRVQVD